MSLDELTIFETHLTERYEKVRGIDSKSLSEMFKPVGGKTFEPEIIGIVGLWSVDGGWMDGGRFLGD